MQQYKKIPVTVTAVQFSLEMWVYKRQDAYPMVHGEMMTANHPYIITREGRLYLEDGDWIIEGESEEHGVHHWVNKADYFAKAYTPSPANAEQEGLRWLPINDKVDGWQLCRLKGTINQFPLMIAPNVIVDFAGKSFKREELEYIGESTTPPVKEVDKEEIFEFIAWILEQGYKIVESQTGPCFQKGTEYSRSVRWLYREFRKMEPAPVKEAGQPALHVLQNLTLTDIDAPTFTHTAEFRKHFDYIKEKFMEALKGQPAPSGLRWVNCATEMPPIEDGYDEPSKYIFRGKGEDPRSGWIVNYIGASAIREMVKDFDYCEWLSDSPAPVQVDPRHVIEWLQNNTVAFLNEYNTDELLEKYTQSLQPKP